MSRSQRGTGAFGRDDMNQLLGGGLSELVIRTGLNASSESHQRLHPSRRGIMQKDVSSMTAAETAAWLKSQQQDPKSGGIVDGVTSFKDPSARNAVVTQRHRAAKVRQYHQLLVEQVEIQQHPKDSKRLLDSNHQQTQDFDVEDGAVSSDESQPQQQSNVVVKFSTVESDVVSSSRRRSRRYYSSDSDSSEPDQSTRRESKKRALTSRSPSPSSSSTCSDEERNQRRKRLVRHLQQKADYEENENRSKVIDRGDSSEPISESSLLHHAKGRNDAPSIEDNSSETSSDPSSDDDSASTSSEEEDEEEDDSDDSDNNESVGGESDSSKPSPIVFVPKHKRHLQPSIQDEERAQIMKEQRKRETTRLRKQESRALVQQLVMEASSRVASNCESALDGITGAKNPVPDDADDDATLDVRRDDWEVRELMRLLADIDLARSRELEAAEIVRRRGMTDDQRRMELQQTGSLRTRELETDLSLHPSHQGQRYYHKGAFFMDNSEWNESDVRHRADEYARATTENDRNDMRKLPSIMQKKGFGRANQSKYQGLSKEDTTDKRADALPLIYQAKDKLNKL